MSILIAALYLPCPALTYVQACILRASLCRGHLLLRSCWPRLAFRKYVHGKIVASVVSKGHEIDMGGSLLPHVLHTNAMHILVIIDPLFAATIEVHDR